MQWELMSEKTVELTEDVIRDFRSLDGLDVERDLKPARLKYHEAVIEHEECIGYDWSIGVLPDETLARVDGNHTSTLLLQRLDEGQSIPSTQVRIRKYRVKDLDDLIDLFHQFNSTVSSRSKADKAGAQQKRWSELFRIPAPLATKIVQGVAWFKKTHKEADAPRTEREVGRLYGNSKVRAFVLWIEKYMTPSNVEIKGSGQGVLACLWGMYEKSPEDATKFVELWVGGIDDPSSPVHLCREEIAASMNSGVKNSSPRFRHDIVARCWNLYRTDATAPTRLSINLKKPAPVLE